MPINKEQCIRYRDTWAAPGSALHAALEAGQTIKACEIYLDCERRLLEETGLVPMETIVIPAQTVAAIRQWLESFVKR